MDLFIAVGFHTIWFTPIVFVLSLIKIIKAIKEGEEHKGHTVACVVSFWLMIVPIFLAVLL
jgi:hypothetical protein